MSAYGPAPQSSSTQTSEVWFSPTEAATVLHVGKRSIYSAIRDGSLKASRVNGRDLRIARGWLHEWALRKLAR